jgi:hypothetical protein
VNGAKPQGAGIVAKGLGGKPQGWQDCLEVSLGGKPRVSPGTQASKLGQLREWRSPYGEVLGVASSV